MCAYSAVVFRQKQRSDTRTPTGCPHELKKESERERERGRIKRGMRKEKDRRRMDERKEDKIAEREVMDGRWDYGGLGAQWKDTVLGERTKSNETDKRKESWRVKLKQKSRD